MAKKMKGVMPAKHMNPMPATVGRGKKGTTITGGGAGAPPLTPFKQHLLGRMSGGGKSIKCP